jgi:hypothetical protein
VSSFWRYAFKLQYRLLAWLDPLIRAFWKRYGIGVTVELVVARRRGGQPRSRLVGLLRVGDREYVGHPNGDVGWTRDLTAAMTAKVTWPTGDEVELAATRLDYGDERTAAIRATTQQPFPGNVIYRVARRHIFATGVYFRLEPPSEPNPEPADA